MRENLADVLEAASEHPVEVTRHGKPLAVIVSAKHYRRLEEAREELDDIHAFDEALATPTDVIPWDEVKKDLGL